MPRLICHRGRSVVSRAIQLRDRLTHDAVWANHVSIELVPGDRLIEALGRGVAQTRTLGAIVGRAEEAVRVFELPPAFPRHERDAAEWLRAQVGRPYDFAGILGFVLPWHGIRGRSGSWFCSELAKAYCDRRRTPLLGTLCEPPAPRQLGVYVEPHTVDPSDVMDSPLLHELDLDEALAA